MARNRTGLTWLFLAVIGIAITGSCMALGVPAHAQGIEPAATDIPMASLPDNTGEYASGSLLVAFAPTAQSKDRMDVLATNKLQVVGKLDGLDISIVSVPAGEELTMAKKLSQMPGVRFAEPDYVMYALGDPNDTYYSTYQWNMSVIDGPTAWDISTGSSSITIAIADTGIDLNHPDLASKIVAGYDFVNNDSTAQDDHGHGTHCAGIAAAITDNSRGVAGVNWQASLMPLKVLDSTGSGYDSDVASSIVWAVDHGATVVSLSLGGTDQSQTLMDAIDYAHDHDVVIVAAAGNEYQEGNPTVYPAAYDHVIGVAATGSYDEHAYYSNTGYYVDIAAPGGNAAAGSSILSTYWQAGSSGYEFLQGTSMATPHVAGLVALIQTIDPTLTADEVEWLIESTAADLGTTGRDDTFGWGRIDAAAALGSIGDPAPTPSPTPEPVCLASSAHPYSNYINQTWTVQNPDGSAALTRVHFSRLETESGYDYVILRDQTGHEVARYDGSYPAGLWSEAIPGATVQVQLVSDIAITAWGFCVDEVETVAAPAIRVSPESVSQTLEQDTSTQAAVTLYNDGTANLNYDVVDEQSGLLSASDASWISVTPTSGTVAPGGQQVLTVNLASAGLSVGQHVANLIVSSDDPIQPETTIPVELDVTVANDVILRFDPADTQVAQGMRFRVDMLLSSGAQPVDSVDAVIRFDPAILQVVDEQGNPSTTIEIGDAPLLPLANSVDNAAGTITFGAVRPLGDSPPAGDLHLATIRFIANAQTLSPTGTPLVFDGTSEAYYGGLSILDGMESGSVIVQASWFTGLIVLQGHGTQPGDRWANYPVTITFLDATDQVVDELSVTTNESGYVSILTPPSGTFDLRIKGEHTLSNLRESVTLPAGGIVDLGLLREGDANNDNRVSGIDFSLLATAYGASTSSPNWDSRVDFNDDERVSAADFSLLASNYGMQGPLTVATDVMTSMEQYPRTMNLFLTPVKQLVGRDGIAEFRVLLDTQGRLVDTVDLSLAFDPKVLAVVDASGASAGRIIPGESLSQELKNKVDRDTGRINYSAGIYLGDEPVAGQLEIATIRLRALDHTRNGMQGTTIEFLPGTEAYLAGQAQLNSRVGGVIVVSVADGKAGNAVLTMAAQ